MLVELEEVFRAGKSKELQLQGHSLKNQEFCCSMRPLQPLTKGMKELFSMPLTNIERKTALLL
jgi:hypothetical protein